MASRRFLTIISPSKFLRLVGIGIISSFLVIGCGTTEKTQRDPGTTPSPSDDAQNIEETGIDEDFLAVLNTYRSTLSDVYSGLDNDIPAVFRQQSTARDIGDPNEGYRIQILSTRSVEEADAMANEFRSWARMEFTEYIPKAYVLFRQPYYKVHIGNFQFHDHAMKLNKVLKSRFPDAWVVHDEVEPELVPSESIEFSQN